MITIIYRIDYSHKKPMALFIFLTIELKIKNLFQWKKLASPT